MYGRRIGLESDGHARRVATQVPHGWRTTPSALAGKRSKYRLRSSVSQPRPSTPHVVTSCQTISSCAAEAIRGKSRPAAQAVEL